VACGHGKVSWNQIKDKQTNNVFFVVFNLPTYLKYLNSEKIEKILCNRYQPIAIKPSKNSTKPGSKYVYHQTPSLPSLKTHSQTKS